MNGKLHMNIILFEQHISSILAKIESGEVVELNFKTPMNQRPRKKVSLVPPNSTEWVASPPPFETISRSAK